MASPFDQKKEGWHFIVLDKKKALEVWLLRSIFIRFCWLASFHDVRCYILCIEYYNVILLCILLFCRGVFSMLPKNNGNYDPTTE